MNFPYLKFITFIVGVIVFVNISIYMIFMNFLNILIIDGKNTIERTISSYEEIDLQNICIVMDCKSIKIITSDKIPFQTIFKKDKFKNKLNKIILTKDEVKNRMNKRTLYKNDDFILTNELNLIFEIPEYNLKIETNRKEFIESQIYNHIFLDILAILLFGTLFILSYMKEKRKHLISIRNTSEEIRDKNMKILTENIHHELKTPLAIIQGITRINEIAFESLNYITKRNKHFNNVDFESIYTSIERINIVLLRMSDFKQTISNLGNRTIYEIINIPTKNVEIYNHYNFNIELDKKFNKYTIKGSLTNEDLMNIVSSLLKNSIEAKSSTIKIECDLYRPNKLHIYIIDNGIGIRNVNGTLKQKNEFNQIFKENTSTKNIDGESRIENTKNKYLIFIYNLFSSIILDKPTFSRGNGLYINKQILEIADSDLKLIETSEKGTVFRIEININEVKNEKNEK